MTPSQVIQTVQLFILKNNHTNKIYLKIQIFSQKQTLLKSCKSSTSNQIYNQRFSGWVQRLNPWPVGMGVSSSVSAIAGVSYRSRKQTCPVSDTWLHIPWRNTGTHVPGLLICLAFFFFFNVNLCNLMLPQGCASSIKSTILNTSILALDKTYVKCTQIIKFEHFEWLY